MKKLVDLVPKRPEKLADNVNIWLEAAELTAKYKCISFAQGFPEFEPPEILKKNLISAIENG